MVGKKQKLMGRRKKEVQLWPGSQKSARKFYPDGRDSRNYKTNPGVARRVTS